MANAVYNSFEDYLNKDTSNPVPHHSFDLSHIRNFTTDYGALIPFCCLDCLPTDSWNISNTVKVQALPMSNPLFNNIRVMTWYFFVPYQLLWRKFEKVMTGGRDGTFTAQFPVVHVGTYSNSLADYLGLPLDIHSISDGVASTEPLRTVSAFPFAAYQHIYRDYFMSQDNQTSSNNNPWFPPDDDEFSLRDGVNVAMSKWGFFAPTGNRDNDVIIGTFKNRFSSPDILLGPGEANLRPIQFSLAWYSDTQSHLIDKSVSDSNFSDSDLEYTIYNYDSPTSWLEHSYTARPQNMCPKDPYLGFLRFKNWRRDYFTSAMFSPQRGPVTSIAPQSYDDFLKANGLLPNGVTVSDDGALHVVSDSDGHRSFAILDSSGNTSAGGRISTALTNIFAGGRFTISDIMMASQIQLWLERNMQVKSQFDDFLRVHFGDSFKDTRLYKPQFIGGTVQDLNISQVIQTSESATTPQGTATGHGQSYNSDFVGKYYCREYGLIMGILCITPDTYYTSGVDKTIWMKNSRFDFVFPEFSQLPPEPIFNFEIYGNDSNLTDKSIFGYSGRLDNYRHCRSMSVSDLRNPYMTDFYSWNITREFSSTPVLNSNAFISTITKYGSVCCPPLQYVADASAHTVKTKTYSTVRHDHFPTGYTQNPFIVQVGISARASRPIPFRNEPQTLNLRTN